MSSDEDDFVVETVEEICDDNESYSNQAVTIAPTGINSPEDNVQDDLDLIALVEGNPRLYAKGKAGYRNVQEKDMAWVSIGKAMKNPLSGSVAKHRWETLRNLYGRARREIATLTKQQGWSGSGRDDVSYENLLTPQSMAIHRFMAELYVPRKTVSNYTDPSLTASCFSNSFTASKSRLPSKSHFKSLPVRPPSQVSILASQESTTPLLKESSVNRPNWNQNFVERNMSENSESTDDQASMHSFRVPKSDIRKRKKPDLETQSVFIESSQAIAAACSALPALLSGTIPKADTKEEEGMVAILLQGLKRVPVQQRTRCLIKLLEILESFQHD